LLAGDQKVEASRMTGSVEEFLELVSNTQRLREFEADEHVWLSIVDGYPEHREAVLLHKDLPDAVLIQLAADPDPRIRLLVVHRGKLPVKAREILAKDVDPAVRAVIARNPLTPVELVRTLMLDASLWVAKPAFERMADRPEAAELFAALAMQLGPASRTTEDDRRSTRWIVRTCEPAAALDVDRLQLQVTQKVQTLTLEEHPGASEDELGRLLPSMVILRLGERHLLVEMTVSADDSHDRSKTLRGLSALNHLVRLEELQGLPVHAWLDQESRVAGPGTS
jgi:hypothetical protein